jgi:hypothetical protein
MMIADHPIQLSQKVKPAQMKLGKVDVGRAGANQKNGRLKFPNDGADS